MVVSEQLLVDFYGGKTAWSDGQTLKVAAQWGTYVLAVAGVLAAGWWASRRGRSGDASGQVTH